MNSIVIGTHLNIAACQQMNSADEKDIVEPEEAPLFSIQAEIIKLIQTANGQNPYYATTVKRRVRQDGMCLGAMAVLMKPVNYFHHCGCENQRWRNHFAFQMELSNCCKLMMGRMLELGSPQTANTVCANTFCVNVSF